MNTEQAKSRLQAFLGEKELTFSIKRFDNGEWIAECNEIPAITTGGMGDDITVIDSMIREAILAAAGISQDFSKEIIRFVGFKAVNKSIPSFLNMHSPEIKNQAEYAI